MLGSGRTTPREGMPSPRLDEAEFKRRYREHFFDAAFEALRDEIERITQTAWEAYRDSRKSPVTQKAGEPYADPEYDLSVDWIRARQAIDAATLRHNDKEEPPRILLVNGSPRSEHTCPGEMSKSYRLIEVARQALAEHGGLETEVLDLSRTVSEYGRTIHPCKACFSTAAALCHWPCSCYPNHSLGQIHDWMNDIYPMWVAAHGVMIVTPVHWYQATSPLKLMIDRLVCADGGNPDPTLTHGKDAAKAKKLELDGWDYPEHLQGRLFAVVAHGDAEGAGGVRRALSDWMGNIGMIPAGQKAEIDRYIGYYKPYATSHAELDEDEAVQEEVRNAARTLAEAVKAQHAGHLTLPGYHLHEARAK
jgi:multimeric flavodoxin WrbA